MMLCFFLFFSFLIVPYKLLLPNKEEIKIIEILILRHVEQLVMVKLQQCNLKEERKKLIRKERKKETYMKRTK